MRTIFSFIGRNWFKLLIVAVVLLLIFEEGLFDKAIKFATKKLQHADTTASPLIESGKKWKKNLQEFAPKTPSLQKKAAKHDTTKHEEE